MKRLRLVVFLAAVILAGLLIWSSQQKWFPHKEDHFGQRQVKTIIITKVGPNNVLIADKKVEDPAKIAWFCKQLNDGYVTWFEGFFGVMMPVDVFLDDRGEVITAAYCRTPEYRVCFVDVTKKDGGYVVTNDNVEYGIR